jgi:hypothetical protein
MRAGQRVAGASQAFFWICVASALTAFWLAVRHATVATPRLVRWSVFTLLVLAMFVVATLHTVGQLPAVDPAVAQRKVFGLCGVALILVVLALSLR